MIPDTLLPGTYILVLLLPKAANLQIGRLGRFDFVAGFYTYVGSAMGPGGLSARLRHHLHISNKPHWHIDYLRPSAKVEEIWYREEKTILEHHWADVLSRLNNVTEPVKGFGASDCPCSSHLFYSESLASLQLFPDKQGILKIIIEGGHT
jgi:Uri superfamily endonuclease